MERPEFENLIDFMAHEDYLGVKKMEQIIKILLKKSQKKIEINQKQQKLKVKQNLKEQLFNQYSKIASMENQSTNAQKNSLNNFQGLEFIDYLRFFPIYFSFFLEFTKKRLEVRLQKLNQIIGIEKNPIIDKKERDPIKIQYIEIQNVYTLVKAFKQIGLDFFNPQDRLNRTVTFRQIEQILIEYKNAYHDQHDSQQVSFILQDLMKYLDVDPMTHIERKHKTMEKIIYWLALKLGVHSCLSNLSKNLKKQDLYRYKEEILLWNTVMYSQTLCNKINFSSKYPQGFFQYLEKKKLINSDLDKNILEEVLQLFLPKRLPLILPQSIQRITEHIYLQQPYILNAQLIGDFLYDYIIQEIEYRLKYYINKTYIVFGKEPTKDFLKQKQLEKVLYEYECRRQNQINSKNKDQLQAQAHFQNSNTKLQAVNNFLSKAQPFQQKKIQYQPDNQEIQRKSKLSSINIQSKKVLEKYEKEPELQQRINSTSQQPFILNPKQKKIKQEKTDLVNSCFIMENFLEKFLYLKKHDIHGIKHAKQDQHQSNSGDHGMSFIPSINQLENDNSQMSNTSAQLYGNQELKEFTKTFQKLDTRQSQFQNQETLLQLQKNISEEKSNLNQSSLSVKKLQFQEVDKIETEIEQPIIKDKATNLNRFSKLAKLQGQKKVDDKKRQSIKEISKNQLFYFSRLYLHNCLQPQPIQENISTVKSLEDYKDTELNSVKVYTEQQLTSKQEQIHKIAIIKPEIVPDTNLKHEFKFFINSLKSESHLVGIGVGFSNIIKSNQYMYDEKSDQLTGIYCLQNDGNIIINNQKKKNPNQMRGFNFKQGDEIIIEIDFQLRKINFVKLSDNQFGFLDEEIDIYEKEYRARKTFNDVDFLIKNQTLQKKKEDLTYVQIPMNEQNFSDFHVICMLQKSGDSIDLLGSRQISKTEENVNIEERFTNAKYLKNQLTINKRLLDIDEQEFQKIHIRNKKSPEKKKDRVCDCQIF